MPYLICLSSFGFTLWLIQATLEKNPYRFKIKVVACAHFLLLGLGALFFSHLELNEYGLVYGLLFSFCGDLCLGLRSKGKIYLPLGLLFFIFAQVAFLSIFPFHFFNIALFAVTMLIQILAIGTLTLKFGLNLPSNIALLAMLYDFLLIGVFILAIGSYQEVPSMIGFLRLSASFMFLLSDSILFTHYFIRPKQKAQVCLYLLLYQSAQMIFAFTLWL